VQLDGTLEKFPLRELIEMVIYSSVIGVLELRIGNNVGQIFFRDGQPYHAVIGDRVGMEAVYVMFEEVDAPFRFVSDIESPSSTLWLDPWEMIERGAEQARLWSGVRQRIASVDHVPALVGNTTRGVHIDETVWPVLAAVDSERSIREIADYLNWMPLDTCIALAKLLDQEIITLLHPRPRRLEPRPLPPAPPTTDRAPSSGFLERLLADAQPPEQPRPDLTDDDLQDRKRVNRYVGDY
jgi:uncharacterized protein DUF4388